MSEQKESDDSIKQHALHTIFELSEISNTRATLRATEMYLSEIFKWAQKNRGGKILLVLEEAHTIIPEINLYGHDKVDTAAVVGRMSQIALQGRKYHCQE